MVKETLDPEETSISSTEENEIHSLQNLDHSFQTDREVPQTVEESELVVVIDCHFNPHSNKRPPFVARVLVT